MASAVVAGTDRYVTGASVLVGCSSRDRSEATVC